MPINNSLPDKVFPMNLYWGEEPSTEYRDALHAIRIKAMHAPDRNHLKRYLPEFAMATWEEKPRFNYTNDEREEAIKKLFKMQLLPTAMETIRFTFLISNIDLVDVTHLIRHRAFSFSAHCTGDRDQRHDPCLIKPSIAYAGYLTRYQKIVEDAKQLYADMVDSKQVSILDARTILPRSMANHYYASCNLRDLIGFFKQRLDKQIQPESDNIIALKMLIEVARIFPEIGYAVDLEEPDRFFIKTAQQDESSNLYQPEAKNDVFDWKEQHFIYPRRREDMSGGHVFSTLWNKLSEEYETLIGDHHV